MIINRKSHRYLQHAAIHGTEVSEEKKAHLLEGQRKRTIAFNVLLFVPWFLFCLTILASLERTPLTGRCVGPLTTTHCKCCG